MAQNSSSNSSSSDSFSSSSSSTEIDGTTILHYIYDLASLSAFDSSGTLVGYLDESWDDPQSRDSDSGTLSFKSDEESKLNYKYIATATNETNAIDFKGSGGDTLKASESDIFKETSTGSDGAYKLSATYQAGANTKSDKTDDIKLSISYASKYSEDVDGVTLKENGTGSVSYADGNLTKYALKFSTKISEDSFMITVSDMSYSDADGNKFKFSGSIDDAGTIKVKSLSITTDDGDTKIKVGKATVEESGYSYQDLITLGENPDTGDVAIDFNGTADGMGTVADFVDLIGTWVDLYNSQA